ncbi:unnamed protein product [Clavelina lepadiformis]|uniref:Arrestin-like N-terminal domain-containing protein n=1 Tax=Clavelina lepadiformis TaxID=159417 RepID=A0ABP0H095_CLALP
MGKVKSFHIAFNGDKSVFVAGEIITGNIILQLNESMKARALRIKFHGKAHVHWSEQRGSGKNRRRVHYNANEDYFHNVVSVHGKESGGMSENAESIPAGQNIFPFQFQLPAELPSSFEGRHGYIRYYAKATIDKPWKFDHNTKKAFTILDNVDLNQDPDARLPVTANDSKTLCCLCCASGPIQAEVHLDRAGYVPGEFIMVNANVENGR